MISLHLQGVEQMMQQLQQFGPQVMPPATAALEREGNRIMLESQRLVPIDTGRLLLTSQVSAPVVEGPVITVELSYGRDGPLGPAPYAMIVHFDAGMHHPHGGQAFFLQQPLFAAAHGFLQRIAAVLGSRLGRS
jgi:hypothetical protein